jgi:SPP1 family predicted phage head-tail adaptor
VKAGDLNRLVRIERRVDGEDAAGQPLQTWEPVASVWASVRAPKGMGIVKEAMDGAVSITRYSFRIRYREALDAGMRVVMAGQAFDVKAVSVDHAGKEWTDLVCELGGAEG